MKRKILALICMGALLAGGCGAALKGQTADNAPAPQTAADDDKAQAAQTATADAAPVTELLDKIFGAVPGTAGCSLKSVAAAAALLDWSEDYAPVCNDAEFAKAVADWKADKQTQLGDIYTDGDMQAALMAVRTDARQMLDDPDSMKERMDEAGCSLSHADYREENLELVCEALAEVFSHSE